MGKMITPSNQLAKFLEEDKKKRKNLIKEDGIAPFVVASTDDEEEDEEEIAPVQSLQSYLADPFGTGTTLLDVAQQKDNAERLNALVEEQNEKAKENEGWFKSSKGDIVGKIYGTTGDILTNVFKGAGNLFEGITDLVLYGFSEGADLVGADSFSDDLKNLAKQNTVNDAFSGMENMFNEYSVLGNKSDSIAQGVGQIGGITLTGNLGNAGKLGSFAMTTGLMGLSSWGSGMSEAFQSGEDVSDADAWAYGFTKGVVDAGTEMIFGGLGKGINALGFSRGISSLDDMFAKKLSSKIANRAAKNLVQFGVKASAEGVEEWMAGLGTAFAKKLTYMSDEDLRKLIADENLLDQFVAGMITSGIAQSGIVPGMNQGSLKESIKTGTDFVTGMTQNEQKVVDKVFESEVKQREESGEKLTKKDKNKLYESVKEQMERGEISTDTIEEVLGGESYKAYKESVDSETALKDEQKALQEEYDKLNKKTWQEMTGEEHDRRDELKTQIKDLQTKIDDQQTKAQQNELKAQLGKNVSEMVKSDRLVESYNEKAKRSQSYQADLSQYDAKQQKTIQNAIDSGILNNTNRTHEFVDLIAKVSADKGVPFNFTDNAKLKESGFSINGKTVNGYVTKDGVTLNINSNKALNSVVGHEIAHVLEGTAFYDTLQQTLFDYAKSKGDYQGRYDALTELYKDVKDAKIDAELTADLVGDYLFADSEFIRNLSVNHRNIFEKIFDEIKYLCKVATAGSKEARELEKVKKAFEDAYRAEGKAQGGTKYSLFLNQEDIPDYLKAGNRQNKNRQKRYEAGQQMVISSDTEFETFVKKSVEGNPNAMVAYGKVEDALAQQVKEKSNSTIDIENAYLELLSDDVQHAYREHSKAKEPGDMDMSIDDLIYALKNVNQSEVVSARQYKDGGQRVTLAMPTDDGMMLLVEIASKSAGTLRLKTGWKVTTEKFTQKYRSGTSTTGSANSTNTVREDTASNDIVSKNSEKSSGNSDIQFSLSGTVEDKSVTNQNPTDNPDIHRSLSNIGEQPKQYGSYNVYGEDIAFDAPIENSVQNDTNIPAENVVDDAPVIKKPVEEAEEIPVTEETEMFLDDFAQMAEDVANEQQSENFESLDDADAPMESVTEYDEMADTATLAKNAISEIAKEVRTSLGLKNNEMADVYRMIEEYSRGEYQSREQLYRDIKDKFGTRTEKIVNDEVQDVKSYLHSYRISVSDSIKNEIADYGDLQRRNRGRIIFSRNGMPVDSAYQELHENYPQFFPESIYNPTDQLLRILDVANMDKFTENSYRIDDETLWGVADDIIDYINDVKYTENEKIANALSREAFDSLMADFITSENQQPTPIEDAPTIEVSNAKGEVDGQQAFMPDAVAPEAITRKALHQGIVEDAKARFSEKGLDFDDVLNNAKDLSTFATVDNTPQRVMEKALGYKEGGVLADLTVNKVAQNETEGIKWLNSFTDRKNGLLAQISKQYNIKPGSKQSAAAQMYAEGFYVDDNNNIIQYGDAELAKDFPDAAVQKNIKGLASDPRIRQIYDDTLAMINESRTRNAYPEIPRLDNYFLHFRAMEDTFSRLGLPFNPNDIRAKDLPTDLNGVTADLKPGQPYFASAMHRTGKRTSFDLLGGLEKYLTSAKNQIYHIDDIQTLRALRNYIADTYGQANGLEGLDALTEEEAQERIKQVYNSHLSTFAKFLNEEANVLAGKTALIDRGLEGIIGRRGITFLDNVNKQVGSNMVGVNVSSSLTNILPVVQTFAKTNKFDFLKAFAQTTANRVGSIFGRTDGFAENSSVIVRRKGADRFHRTLWQKLVDPGYALMGAVDSVSTELIARTKYNELTRKGMDSQKAHYETDKWVSRLMGDRSLGQQPQLYNSKMLGLFTKFQLEVRNQLDSQFYDTIKETGASTEDIQNGLARNAKKAAKITSTFVQLAVVQHLFGMGFEAVAGYNPAFDIIDVIVKMFGWDDDEDSEDTALDNIEEGFLALLGDLPYTSTLTGGRIPIESALPIKELVMGEDEYGNEKSRLETLGEIAPYYLMPGGYGQAKKTVQGLGMFDEDHPIAGSYTDSGKLRFPVEDTLLNRVQAGIFGQWASDNARDYFDSERKPLDEKQIQEFIDSDMPIQDYWDYREGLSGLSTLAEKADYIDSLDLTTEQKNLLINNIADRKEAIDMSDYGNYGSFEEFDYAKQNPEKYTFLKNNKITYDQYKSFSEDAKDAWNWAYENPEKFEMSKAVSSDVVTYRKYTSDLYDIKADKDENGKSISGSRKKKVVDYLNRLDIDYGAKLILFKSEFKSDDTYNMDIIDYLNSRKDISYKQMETILKELGFRVDSKGNIWWD